MIDLRPAALVLAFLLSASVRGQASPPIVFQPPAPTTSDPISIGFYKSACVLTVDLPTQIDVVRMGAQVEVVIDGAVEYNGLLCVFSPGTVTLPIGRLPPGHYTVRVIIRDYIQPSILYPPIAAGGIAVTPATVPTLATHSLALLALLALVAGLLAHGLRWIARVRLR